MTRRKPRRNGTSVDEYAAQTAARWKNGLAEWDQSPERIQRLRDAADVAIYTPGSQAGLPLTVLKSLDAPPETLANDADAMRERVSATASGLLTLLGIDADPLRSREHILLSNILDHTWRAGKQLDLPALIQQIQTPPIDRIGVMDLKTVFPAKDRMQLAMTVNNVLASPGFAGWLEGEALNIQRLLYTAEGKPRLTILSIAHLGDAERMFFVTILLNEVIAWMRSQPGTSSLRALLYMDEVFGYLPPTANPPSKTPLLTLLKQARAYGLGLVLATQNPVDLDYKALSNAGTWFLGRLQTERDKLRVLDGLEGASSSSGVEFDRGRVEQILSGLSSRKFLMNNVHEDAPVVFQTRWALSYLRGPLTREQIQTLMADRKAAEPEAAPTEPPAAKKATAPVPAKAADVDAVDDGPPVLSGEISQRYAAAGEPGVLYQPALLGSARMHFVDAKSRSGIDVWNEVGRLSMLNEDVDDPWDESEEVVADELKLSDKPAADARYVSLPAEAAREKSYGSWEKDLKDFLYRELRLPLWHCAALKAYSKTDEAEGDFRGRLKHQLREERDLQIEKLRKSYAPKIERLNERIEKAEERVEVEEEQASSATMSAAMSIGSSLLGALFGRKLASSTNVSRATTSARSVDRASRQRSDIKRAKKEVESIREDLAEMEQEFEEELKRVNEELVTDELVIEPYEVKPRKTDIDVGEVELVWLRAEG